jgi:transcriptional regulator with XRE-family HTH domain
MIKSMPEPLVGRGREVSSSSFDPGSHASHDIGARLAMLRRRSGMSGNDVAAATKMSQSRISRIETGVTTPSVRDVHAIAKALELPREEIAALQDILDRIYGKVRDWRATGGRLGALQDDVGHYEQAAEIIKLLQTTVVPGLLQTAEYTRSILGVYENFDHAEPINVATAVAKRLVRQQILYDRNKTVFVVFLESVLHYRLCSPPVMLAQIDRIREVSRLENVKIRIVPMMQLLPIVAPHPVEIFDDSILTIDLATTALFADGASDLDFYTQLFDAYFEVATEDIDPILNRAYRRFAKLLNRDGVGD